MFVLERLPESPQLLVVTVRIDGDLADQPIERVVRWFPSHQSFSPCAPQRALARSRNDG